MTKKYNQLTLEQRYKIEALNRAGKSQAEIASIIGVHRSTICRELKRNAPQTGKNAGVYVANRANDQARKRHKTKHKHTRFTPSLKRQMWRWVIDRRFSPELVSAQWKREGIDGVSHETIYRFIWECKHTNKEENRDYKYLHKYLKHGRRKRKRGNYKDSRGIIPDREFIENRPKIVEKRKRLGDIEVDLIIGKGHKSALLVTTDRATLKTTMDKLIKRDPGLVAEKLIHRLKHMPKINTITFDNDRAFSLHKVVANALNASTYFTRPYTSQDKGTIENRNGIIRMFFPKKTDFQKVTSNEIKRVENEINNRPVRKFGYLSPNEVFFKLNGSVALIS